MSGSTYTFRRYRDEMIVLFGGDEEWTNDTPTTIDAGQPDAVQAMALTDARREVLTECLKVAPEWVAREQSLTWPDADFILIDPPGSSLQYVPQSLLLVTDVQDGIEYPIHGVGTRDRFRYIGNSNAAAYGAERYATLTGGRLYLGPRPVDRTIAITYAPLPDMVTRADLTSERADALLPYAAQFAVPIRAAMNLCVRDQRPHAQLAAKWAEAQARIAEYARQRAHAFPRYPSFTRPPSEFDAWIS